MMQIRRLLLVPFILWLTLLAACQPNNPTAPGNTEQEEEVQPGDSPDQEEEEDGEQEEDGEED